MMKKKHVIFVFLFFLIVVFGGLALFLQKEERLEVTGVSPSLGEANVLDNKVLKIDFNKKPKNIDFKVEPAVKIEKEVVENHLFLKPKEPFLLGTVYRVFLFINGEPFFSWHFKTKERTEEDVLNEELDRVEKYYPLMRMLPFATRDFRITYKGELYLKVTYKGDLEKVKKEVFSWVEKNGEDPTNHRYEWVEEKGL